MVQQQAHYNDDTPNNFPDDYDESKVDSRVRLRSKAIRGKYRGVDVRGALAQGIEIAGAIAGESVQNASDAKKIATDSSNHIDTTLAAITNEAGGEGAAAEVIAGRTDKDGNTYDSLGKRLNAMPTQKDVAYAPLANAMVQNYNVPGSVDKLESFALSIRTDVAFKMLFLTDVHFGKGTNDQPTLDAYPERDYVDAPPLSIAQLCNMRVLNGTVDCAVMNGDNVHGHEGHDVNLRRNRQSITTARAALLDTDLFITVGNHDSGQVWDKTKDTAVKRNELLDIYDYSNNAFGETRKDFAAYKDYPDKKVRLISLAGFDNPEIYTDDGITLKYPSGQWSVYSQSQLDFVASALSTVPDGFAVLMTTHAPLQGFFGNTSTTASVNHDLLKGILSAYVGKTTYTGIGTVADCPASVSVDFTNAKGDLAGIINGHQHRDRPLQTVDGINAVERTCFLAADRGDSSEATYTTKETLGTIDQYAFDVVEVDTSTRTVSFKRFGVGSDYSYEY
jgi:hypothetical protein